MSNISKLENTTSNIIDTDSVYAELIKKALLAGLLAFLTTMAAGISEQTK